MDTRLHAGESVHRGIISTFCGALLLGCGVSTSVRATEPPVAPIRPVVDDYHGIKVTDPYRYMEQFTAPDVRAWVKGQGDYTAAVLSRIPGRDRLFERLKELNEGAPYRVHRFVRRPGDRVFYLRRGAQDDVAQLYVRNERTGQEKLLVDPRGLRSGSGEHAALQFFEPSPDGRHVVYGLSFGGAEEPLTRVVETDSARVLADVIELVESEYVVPQWRADGQAFFYSRRVRLADGADPTEGFKNTKVYLHPLGDDPERDRLLLAAGVKGPVAFTPVDFPSIQTFPGSGFAIAQIKHGDSNEVTLFAAPADSVGASDTPWKRVCDVDDAVSAYAVHGDDIYLRTSRGAPRFKLLRTRLSDPDIANAALVVPAGELVLGRIGAAKDALYVEALEDGMWRVFRLEYAQNAKPQRLVAPENAELRIAAVNAVLDGVWLEAAWWTRAEKTLAYDPTRNSISDLGLEPRGRFDDPRGLTSVAVKVRSHDGVRVPLSIVHRADLRQDGTNPTYLLGYGAYGATLSASFDPTYLAWFERGGVFAIAHVRGGGEYGKEWHLAGQKVTKPNTWKDFIACAEYLIDAGYTSPSRLAGVGGSAGGILVGRAMTERPDLFAAVIDNVGLSDMLRMETTTNGVPNIEEFGSVTTAEGFRALHAMSPLHHVVDGEKYPAVLLLHGINDPRVEPWMSAKMTARLQAAGRSGRPVLFRVQYDAGHGIGSTMTQRLKEFADRYAFVLWQTGVKDFQPAD